MYNNFEELNYDESMELDGGIAFIPAAIVVFKVVGGCALVGFAAGCVYELILGE